MASWRLLRDGGRDHALESDEGVPPRVEDLGGESHDIDPDFRPARVAEPDAVARLADLGMATDERLGGVSIVEPRAPLGGLSLADEFREAGGKTFIRVPCPNADPRWVAALARLVEEAPAAALAVSSESRVAARA